MKIKIMDREYEVSTVIGTAIQALDTKHNRKVRKLNNTIAAKDEELKTAKNEVDLAVKRLNEFKDSALLKDTISKVLEVDSEFKTDSTNAHEIMCEIAGIEDGKDKPYIEAYFDSYIAAKIAADNQRILDEQKDGDDNIKVPDDYYNRKGK